MNIRHASAGFAGFVALSFFWCLTANAAQFWVDSRFDITQAHYHGPEEACIVGELIRRTNGYQENSNRQYSFGAVYVGPDEGIQEQV